MFRILFFSLLISIVCGPTWAANRTSDRTPERQQELLEKGRSLIEAWDGFEKKYRGTEIDRWARSGDIPKLPYFHMYNLMLSQLGPIAYTDPLGKLAAHLGPQRLVLTQQSIDIFNQHTRNYDPKNYSSEADQEIARRARSIGVRMRFLARSVSGKTAYETIQKIEKGGLSIRYNLGTRMYHFPPELVKFASAIVILRIGTCFGGNSDAIWNDITTWKTPKHTDPVCVDEIMDMLKSPIFYAGFAMFVAGNSIGTTLIDKALHRIDPDKGAKRRAFEKNWVPHIGLAVGFIFDHMTKVFANNKSIFQCLKKMPGDFLANSARNLTVLARDQEEGESYQVLDPFSGFSSIECRTAYHTMLSDQFLMEELAVGITGLVLTAAGMAQASKYMNRARDFIDGRLKISDQLARGRAIVSKAAGNSRLFQTMKSYKFVATPVRWTGKAVRFSVGFAAETARMVVFLALFEVINPYIEKAYYGTIVRAKVDQKTKNLKVAAGKLSSDSFALQQGTTCSELYTGKQEDQTFEVCSKVPLLSQIISFHDYSKIWREKHILKEFLSTFKMWQKKLNSFINNYFLSMQTFGVLSRTREMYLKFKTRATEVEDPSAIEIEEFISDHHKKRLQVFETNITNTLNQFPIEHARENILNTLKAELERQATEQGYKSPYESMRLDTIERQVFDDLKSIEEIKETLSLLPYGLPYFGVNRKAPYPEQEDVNQVIGDIFEFIGEPGQKDYSYVEIIIPGINDRHTQARPVERLRLETLQNLGMPSRFVSYSFDVEIIKLYLSAPNRDLRALGLLLFQEWAPHMYGPFPRHSLQYGETYGNGANPRGLTLKQWNLLEKINYALDYFNPTFSWEYLYYISVYEPLELEDDKEGPVGSVGKIDTDGQFHETSQGLETKQFSDYVLSQLICGMNGSYKNLFGDNGGVALQFPFPHLTEEDLCSQMFHPIRMQDEFLPSPFRSVFYHSTGFSLGLHQRYIRYDGEPKPLVFDKEQQAGDWWNQSLQPKSIEKLKQMKINFEVMIDKEFSPVIADVELDTRPWYDYVFSWFGRFFGGLPEDARIIQASPATESLTLSLINEFYQYRRILHQILDPLEYQRVEPDLIQTGQCLVDLMNIIPVDLRNSLPEKKYRAARTRCEVTLDNVRVAIRDRNDKYTTDAQRKILIDKIEDEMTPVERHDRTVMAVGNMIDALFVEVNTYNNIVNNSFNFELK